MQIHLRMHMFLFIALLKIQENKMRLNFNVTIDEEKLMNNVSYFIISLALFFSICI